MIRDRLVVGIRDKTLSEGLQMDSELTLEKAVTKIRQHEEIKKQQPIVRETKTAEQKEANVDLLKFKKKPNKGNQKGKSSYGRGQKDFQKGQKNCGRCGKGPPHSLKNCAARDAECRKCQRRGHLAAVCRLGRVGTVLEGEEDDTLFLGAVSAGKKPETWKTWETWTLHSSWIQVRRQQSSQVVPIQKDGTVHSPKHPYHCVDPAVSL